MFYVLYGVVTRYEERRGFGFIRVFGAPPNSREIWFHISHLHEVVRGEDGKPKFGDQITARKLRQLGLIEGPKPAVDDHVVFKRSHNKKGQIAFPWVFEEQWEAIRREHDRQRMEDWEKGSPFYNPWHEERRRERATR